jgi:hypothetical protein
MRSKVDTTPLGLALAEETLRAREALAKQVFDLNTLKAACLDAALKGQPGLTIKPPTPVDLSRTDAAQDARAWLDQQGVRATWERRTDPVTAEVIPALVLSWV